MRKFLAKKKLTAEAKMMSEAGRMKDYALNLVKNEKGDTNFVSIIIIIVIVLAVAAIFRTQLIALVNTVFEKLSEFINS